jgi:hypothetical protein
MVAGMWPASFEAPLQNRMVRRSLAQAITGVALLLLLAPPAQDEAEVKAIRAVMLRYYQLLRETPVQALDVQQFGEVLADTPDFTLTAETQQYISAILGTEKSSNAGYLTAMQAKWLHLQQGDRLARAAIEQARAENREVSPEEWQTLAEQNRRMVPPTFTDPDPNYRIALLYGSLEIEGNRAVARFDDGVTYQEAILRKIDGRWYIANIIPLNVHF